MKTYLFENRVISSDESYDGKDPIVVDGKVISVKTATPEQLGVVQPDGETIKINNGIISAEGSKPYELPIADADTLGGVKVGSGLSITGDGVLSATGIEVEIVDNLTNTSPDKALSANMGKTLNDTKQDKLTAGTGISIEDNTISATVSGSDYAGTDPINVDNEQHTISINTATTDTLGVVQPDGTTITIDNGVISAVGGASYELPIADADTLGGVKVGSGLSITSDGVLSANNQGGFSVAVEDITINKEFTPMEGVYANGKYVIVGGSINAPETTNRGIYSTDGIIWTEMTLPSSQNWMSVTYGDGKFVASTFIQILDIRYLWRWQVCSCRTRQRQGCILYRRY